MAKKEFSLSMKRQQCAGCWHWALGQGKDIDAGIGKCSVKKIKLLHCDGEACTDYNAREIRN